MAVRPAPRLMTADELYAIDGDPSWGRKRLELIAGRLVVSEPPPGYPHGIAQVRIAMLLGSYVRERRLGVVMTESGLWISRVPDTVVGCDVSFVRAERVPDIVDPVRYVPFAPDLAVEIRSPGDRKGREEARVATLLAGGVRLVWHVEPLTRRATVHAPGAAPEPLGEDDHLDGRDVVPGFRCPLREALDW